MQAGCVTDAQPRGEGEEDRAWPEPMGTVNTKMTLFEASVLATGGKWNGENLLPIHGFCLCEVKMECHLRRNFCTNLLHISCRLLLLLLLFSLLCGILPCKFTIMICSLIVGWNKWFEEVFTFLYLNYSFNLIKIVLM
jgi:hypothetical protein